MISINYQKRKNEHLFNDFSEYLEAEKTQNYTPLYNNFFSLNTTNYNNINLNHKWYISSIVEKTDDNIFFCNLKNINNNKKIKKDVFFKFAPLFDICKYLTGHIKHNNDLFLLPQYDNLLNESINPDLLNHNNFSYVDGFFIYLSSMLIHNYGFIHGLDYYGSFLSIKNNYCVNITDDIEDLCESEYFHDNNNVLFKIESENYSSINNDNNTTIKPILLIDNSDQIVDLNIDEFNDNIFENVFDKTLSENNDSNILSSGKFISLDDVTNIDFNNNDNEMKEMDLDDSDCSSRTSYTNSDDICDEYSTSNEDNSIEDDDTENDINEDDSSILTDDSEYIEASINKYPIQIIAMENCDDTLDNLINDYLDEDKEMPEEEWFSVLMQIIMILITYQKIFNFTHNDLHTNNIMYKETDKKYIYYLYNKTYYKVPTFGKIFKIIDFGRSIYTFNKIIYCSNSFKKGGDAHTQYNCEPFIDEKKPIIEPNYSFDLCRLACSIIDYLIDDITKFDKTESNKITNLILEWCSGDNGENILYKNNGLDRYHDFKLYKMIARKVHNHIPTKQLDNPIFKKYIISQNTLKNEINIINIDSMKSCV
jgi:hypothetical protein